MRSSLSITGVKILLLLIAFVALTAGKKDKKTGTVAGPQAQVEFGVEMAKRGLWSEALFRFRQANRMSPGNPRVLNNIAVAFEALGNFETALEFYQEAIRSDPGNKELKRNYSRFVEFYRAFRPDGETNEQPTEQPTEQTASMSDST